jgi:hypothetical protein
MSLVVCIRQIVASRDRSARGSLAELADSALGVTDRRFPGTL